MRESWFSNRPWLPALIASAVGVGLAAYALGEAWAQDGASSEAYFEDTSPPTVEGVQGYATSLAAKLKEDDVSLGRIGRTIQGMRLPDSHIVPREYADLRRQHESLSSIANQIKGRAASVSELQLRVDRDTLKQLDPEIRDLTERIQRLKSFLRI